jgi:hypothetical protein
VSGVDDLVTWLRAQLDEDERIAREAADEGDGQWRLATYNDGTTTAWHGEAEVMTALYQDDAVHIRNWDPARVLAEVDARRRMLDVVLPKVTDLQGACDEEWGARPGLDADDLLVRTLALPYSDREGYRDEWQA